jgi:hypothetical protein
MTSRQLEDSMDALRPDERGGIRSPNEETVAAMLEARAIAEAHRARFGSPEDLFNELEIEVRD